LRRSRTSLGALGRALAGLGWTMPWCDDCSKFWNPPELAKGGSCPTCGATVAKVVSGQVVGSQEALVAPAQVLGSPEAPAGQEGRASTAKLKGAPWHFKLLVVGVAGYMVYRVIWFIEWLPKHL
jgi:hypothetical protein